MRSACFHKGKARQVVKGFCQIQNGAHERCLIQQGHLDKLLGQPCDGVWSSSAKSTDGRVQSWCQEVKDLLGPDGGVGTVKPGLVPEWVWCARLRGRPRLWPTTWLGRGGWPLAKYLLLRLAGRHVPVVRACHLTGWGCLPWRHRLGL